MKFERQIQAIADRDALQRFVADLPDDAKALIVVQMPPDEDASFAFHHFGSPTLAESLFMVKGFEHYLFSDPASDE